MPKKKSKSTLIILATILPFVGYFFSYIYEYGYTTYFNIPKEYIHITLEMILLFCFILFGLIVFIILQLEYIFPFLAEKFQKNSLNRFIIIRSILIIIIVIYFALIGKTIILWSAFIAMIIIFYTVPLITPFFRKDKSISYLDHFQKNIDADLKEPTLSTVISDKYSPWYPFIFIILLFIAQIVYGVGVFSASSRTTYHIINNDSSYVVLKIYGDNILMVPPKNIMQEQFNELKVVSASSLKEYILTPYIIGNELAETIDTTVNSKSDTTLTD